MMKKMFGQQVQTEFPFRQKEFIWTHVCDKDLCLQKNLYRFMTITVNHILFARTLFTHSLVIGQI